MMRMISNNIRIFSFATFLSFWLILTRYFFDLTLFHNVQQFLTLAELFYLELKLYYTVMTHF